MKFTNKAPIQKIICMMSPIVTGLVCRLSANKRLIAHALPIVYADKDNHGNLIVLGCFFSVFNGVVTPVVFFLLYHDTTHALIIAIILSVPPIIAGIQNFRSFMHCLRKVEACDGQPNRK